MSGSVTTLKLSDSRLSDLPYAVSLLGRSSCARALNACEVRSPNATVGLNVLGKPSRRKSAVPRDFYDGAEATVCNFCSHGAYMLPYLVRRYGVKSLAEVGVCTGMSVVNVLEQHAAWSGGLAPLERYYMVDPWGERRCNPGCGCSKPLRRLAKAFAPVLVPVQGYSAKMAPSIPNASLDLAFIDAAHDYRNVRADVLAYWPKLKPDGVLAGHDFLHYRNWAEVSQDRQAGRGMFSSVGTGATRAGKALPAYGVAQATQELFAHCPLTVLFGVWWIERRSCPAGPIPSVALDRIA